MQTIMVPFDPLSILFYNITHPAENEKILILAKDVFCDDRRIVTTVNELNKLRFYVNNQRKSEQMTIFMELNELMSSSPSDITYSMLPRKKIHLCLAKYKSKVLLYLVYKEVLFGEEIIRLANSLYSL